jgi:maleylacetoacetate isomerase/maleylpyruvate isomerase
VARTLYSYWRSSAAYRVRIALAWKRLSYDSVPIDLRTGEQSSDEYKAVNPQGFVPFLLEGAVQLGQSLAIIEYLEETYPDPPLLPARAVDRAKVRAMAQIVACDIHPLNNLRVLKYLARPLGLEQAAIDSWARHWIGSGFAALEAAANPEGPYLFGQQVTLADACLAPQLYNARRVSTDLSPYPRLLAVEQRLNELPAFHDARPEVQPGAVA